ncbi:hypothetical protein D9V32_15000 [Mycetocola tolaasinivorans]|uniref:Uncharacterized protein n=1 Tax=Mycetocola tolaasinivorans TaxID=76635 RepID=A0A3L6ZXJ7_9MICO|nr:hypothetical protein [Mycetocola tolaasinivorans]RLP72753.1 hypothetical protein D9V32_15000 [Mycetocola tolaasinivorans]
MTEPWPAPVFEPIEPPRRRKRGLIVTLGILFALILVAGGTLFALSQGIGSTATLRVTTLNNAHVDETFVLGSCQVPAGGTECMATNRLACTDSGETGGQKCLEIEVPEEKRLRVETALGQDAAWVRDQLGWKEDTFAGGDTDQGSCTIPGEPGQIFRSYPFGSEAEYTITRINVFGLTETSAALHGFRMVGHACGDPEDPDHDHDEDGDEGH